MTTASVPDTVFELRQYTLFPGRRDDLIALFEQHFVAPQDAVGARILGTFRDLDDPDRFVWMRGFASMRARHDALTAFYGGSVWQTRRDDAVETMRDSDNVLLLRAAGDGAPVGRPDIAGTGLVLMHDLTGVDADAFTALFDRVGRPMVAAAGGVVAATYVTESATNTFTRLPVRADARVHVALARFVDIDALDAGVRSIAYANALRAAAPDALLPAFMRKPEMLRLAPTAGSRWR